MSKAPRDEQSESGEAVVSKTERAAREFWVQDSDMTVHAAAYAKPEHARPDDPFYDVIHVIEKSAYDEQVEGHVKTLKALERVQKERDELAKFIGPFREHHNKVLAERDRLRDEAAVFAEQMRALKAEGLATQASLDAVRIELEQAKQNYELCDQSYRIMCEEVESLRKDKQHARDVINASFQREHELKAENEKLREDCAKFVSGAAHNNLLNEIHRLRERIKELEQSSPPRG